MGGTRNPEAHTTDLREQLQATLAGTYELERELGGGGMSRVFLAHETSLGRRVVVKVLSPTLAAGVSAERFRREILLVAKLQHPHIVPVHAAGESAGLPWFTMPFVEGESLRARIAREGELPIPEVLRLLRDIASALSYAHAQGVIHRDIKPDNVLLSVGSAVVADFGVAKALSESVTEGDQSHITSLGIALGTPAYMAPEQAAGDPAMDHRVDIYAFGVMAYEMLSGRPPFTGRNPQALFAAHVTEPPVPVQTLRPTVPAALAALVMRCLEKHAADRPTGADDILHALDAMSTPSGGMPPTTEYRAMRGSAAAPPPTEKRVPWPWIAAGLAAAAVIGALVLVPRGARVVPEVATPAQIPVPVPPPERVQPVDTAPSLPRAETPARERARARAPVETRVVVETVTAPSPAPVQVPVPVPVRTPVQTPAPQPVPEPPSDPRPAVESAVAAYAKAIESRSTARIRDVNPGLTAAQEQDWRQFFEAVGGVQVTLTLGSLQETGDVVEATAMGEYVFANSTTRRTERQPATVRMSFRRGSGGAWRLVAIR